MSSKNPNNDGNDSKDRGKTHRQNAAGEKKGSSDVPQHTFGPAIRTTNRSTSSTTQPSVLPPSINITKMSMMSKGLGQETPSPAPSSSQTKPTKPITKQTLAGGCAGQTNAKSSRSNKPEQATKSSSVTVSRGLGQRAPNPTDKSGRVSGFGTFSNAVEAKSNSTSSQRDSDAKPGSSRVSSSSTTTSTTNTSGVVVSTTSSSSGNVTDDEKMRIKARDRKQGN